MGCVGGLVQGCGRLGAGCGRVGARVWAGWYRGVVGLTKEMGGLIES